MNTILWLITVVFTLATPVTEITQNAYNSVSVAWSISFKAARIELEERVANQGDEASEDNEEDNSSEDTSDYTDADVAYWNGLALQYGFQTYNGFGEFSQFVESAAQLVYNAQTYGDPYYEDQGLQVYYEDEDGILWENPIYENRWGPEDDPTNQVQPPVEPAPTPLPPVEPESFYPESYEDW